MAATAATTRASATGATPRFTSRSSPRATRSERAGSADLVRLDGARVARDVDAQGRLLWITAGKTENATRRLEVPECLRAPLVELARHKQPDQLLFTDGTTIPSRQHFWGKLRLFCRHARVPLVCPHSLRGLHATLAIEAGATGGMVAHALGHGSFQVTARHYATAESIAGSRAARVSEALGTKDDAISRLLAELSQAQKRLRPWRRQSLYSTVQRICKEAKVPLVCTHSLRGFWATTSVQIGTPSQAVAATLGHGSFAITERHYAAPGSRQNAGTHLVVEALRGESPTKPSAADILAGLDARQIADLVALLTKNGPLNPSASVSQTVLRSPSATGGYRDDHVGGEGATVAETDSIVSHRP